MGKLKRNNLQTALTEETYRAKMVKGKHGWLVKGLLLGTLIVGSFVFASQTTTVQAAEWQVNSVAAIAARIAPEQKSLTMVSGDTVWNIGLALNIKDPMQLLYDNGYANGEQYTLPVGTVISWDGNHVTVKSADGTTIGDAVVTDDAKMDASQTIAGQTSDTPEKPVAETTKTVSGDATTVAPTTPAKANDAKSTTDGKNGASTTPGNKTTTGGTTETPTTPTTPTEPETPVTKPETPTDGTNEDTAAKLGNDLQALQNKLAEAEKTLADAQENFDEITANAADHEKNVATAKANVASAQADVDAAQKKYDDAQFSAQVAYDNMAKASDTLVHARQDVALYKKELYKLYPRTSEADIYAAHPEAQEKVAALQAIADGKKADFDAALAASEQAKVEAAATPNADAAKAKLTAAADKLKTVEKQTPADVSAAQQAIDQAQKQIDAINAQIEKITAETAAQDLMGARIYGLSEVQGLNLQLDAQDFANRVIGAETPEEVAEILKEARKVAAVNEKAYQEEKAKAEAEAEQRAKDEADRLAKEKAEADQKAKDEANALYNAKLVTITEMIDLNLGMESGPLCNAVLDATTIEVIQQTLNDAKTLSTQNDITNPLADNIVKTDLNYAQQGAQLTIAGYNLLDSRQKLMDRIDQTTEINQLASIVAEAILVGHINEKEAAVAREAALTEIAGLNLTDAQREAVESEINMMYSKDAVARIMVETRQLAAENDAA